MMQQQPRALMGQNKAVLHMPATPLTAVAAQARRLLNSCSTLDASALLAASGAGGGWGGGRGEPLQMATCSAIAIKVSA